MTTTAPLQKNVRLTLTTIFGVFFFANVLVFVLSLWAAFGSGKAVLLPEDLSTGVRLVIFLVGAGISWIAGRWLFMQLIHGDLGVDESSNAAILMLGYLLLMFTGIAFISAWSWLWLLILLLVLVLGTMLILRRIVGLPIALTIITISIILGIVVYKLFR